MNFVIENCTGPEIRTTIESLLATGSLGSILTGWLTPARELTIIGGSDDITGERQTYLLFTEGTTEVGAVYISESDLARHRPIVKELIPPPYRFELDKHEQEEDIYHSRCLEFGKSTWNDDIVSDVINLEAGIDIAVGLALSDHGEARFSHIEEHSVESCDEPEVYEANFLVVEFLRSNAARSEAENWWYHIDLRIQ